MDSLNSQSASLQVLSCVSVRDETADVKTFSFECDEKIAFEAGQALTLALEINGQTLYRTFSISSHPGSSIIDITIKAQATGNATRWLHDHLKAGDQIRTRPPAGRFTIGLKRSEKIALVSAGSGATPLFSMLQYLSDFEPEADVAWVHAARTPADLLFSDRLTELQRKMPNLAVTSVVKESMPGWQGFKGRLGRRMMSVIMSDFAERQVFSCGPAGFMHEMKLVHAAEGGNGTLFHTESFGQALLSAPQPGSIATVDEGPTTTIAVGRRSLQVNGGESVLQACLRQGIIIPCGCGQGMCGTCMVRKVSGHVEMHHQEGITPEQEAAGYILSCCSKPVGDIEIVI